MRRKSSPASNFPPTTPTGCLPKNTASRSPPQKSRPSPPGSKPALHGRTAKSSPRRRKPPCPAGMPPPDPQIVSIEAFPKEIHLETAADFHRVIVIVRIKDESTHDVTRQAKLTLADPVAGRSRRHHAHPEKRRHHHPAHRIPRPDHRESRSPSRTRKNPGPISFQLDVMPVLTAAGCNTGSCHGSARGQDGFHLSLFGLRSQGRPLPPHHRNGRPPHQPRHARGIAAAHQGHRRRPPHRRQAHQTGQRRPTRPSSSGSAMARNTTRRTSPQPDRTSRCGRSKSSDRRATCASPSPCAPPTPTAPTATSPRSRIFSTSNDNSVSIDARTKASPPRKTVARHFC